jgi:hypothetical protein
MKLLLLLIAFSVCLILKKKRWQIKYQSTNIQEDVLDISDLYTINYISNFEVNTEIKNFTNQEQDILNVIKSENFNDYNFYVVGGWVRDKVILIETIIYFN